MSTKSWDEIFDRIERREIIDYSMIPPYIALSASGIIIACTLPNEFAGLPMLVIKFCIGVFCLIFLVTTFVLLEKQWELDRAIQFTAIDVVRKKHDLPLMIPPKEPPQHEPDKLSEPPAQPPVMVQEVLRQVNKNPSYVSEHDYVPPKAELIVWMFETAEATPTRRIKNVREFQLKFPVVNDGERNAIEQLRDLEDSGAIAKLWKSETDNAARGIVPGVTLEQVLELYGYDPNTVIPSPTPTDKPVVNKILEYSPHELTRTKQA